jgi:hypothetical protein
LNWILIVKLHEFWAEMNKKFLQIHVWHNCHWNSLMSVCCCNCYKHQPRNW